MLNDDYKEMLRCLSEENVKSEGIVFQIGNSPRRIDILTLSGDR